MIRPARPADGARIVELVRELADYERALDEVELTEELLHDRLFCDHPAAFCHVAEDTSGEVVGMAVWFLTLSTWVGRHGIWLEDLYVRPTARGAGHGRALLLSLVELARERGWGRVEWAVLDWNTDAQGFYASLGARHHEGWQMWRLLP